MDPIQLVHPSVNIFIPLRQAFGIVTQPTHHADCYVANSCHHPSSLRLHGQLFALQRQREVTLNVFSMAQSRLREGSDVPYHCTAAQRTAVMNLLKMETNAYLRMLDALEDQYPQLECYFGYKWGTSFAALVDSVVFSSEYERGCILFNVAAVCANMARNLTWLDAVHVRQNAEEACALFMKAIKYVEKSRESMALVEQAFPNVLPLDARPSFLSQLKKVLIGQLQEVSVWKLQQNILARTAEGNSSSGSTASWTSAARLLQGAYLSYLQAGSELIKLREGPLAEYLRHPRFIELLTVTCTKHVTVSSYVQLFTAAAVLQHGEDKRLAVQEAQWRLLQIRRQRPTLVHAVMTQYLATQNPFHSLMKGWLHTVFGHWVVADRFLVDRLATETAHLEGSRRSGEGGGTTYLHRTFSDPKEYMIAVCSSQDC